MTDTVFEGYPRARRAALIGAALAAMLCGGGAMAAPSAATCVALAGVTFAPERIGLPTGGAAVTSARLESVGGSAGEACILLGRIAPVDRTAPPITFELNLPTRWNHRAVQLGGGGFDGFLVTGRLVMLLPKDKDPLPNGYATFGSDSGHRAGDGTPMTAVADAAFAENPEALDNFAGAQVKKTHDVALALIRRYYGASPAHVYFYGNSEGGREGLVAAQRYGGDYDGVVSIHPAYNFVRLQLGGLTVGKAIYSTPGAWLSPADTALIAKAALERCDGLDGLADGVIANLAACRAVFDAGSLLCNPAASAAPCLTLAQVRAVRAIAAPSDIGAQIDGTNTFPGWPVLEGAFSTPGLAGFGHSPSPSTPPNLGDAFIYVMADQGVKHFFVHDPTATGLTFDPAAHAEAMRAVAAKLDAVSSDLDAFTRHGGKLLMMHGTIDMAIPPGNSIDYFLALRTRYGARLPGFARFYLAAGFGHVDGAFQVNWDSLAALDAWVGAGRAPGPQIVADASPAHAGRTRPLCEYPLWPRYKGAGNPDAAASFDCVK